MPTWTFLEIIFGRSGTQRFDFVVIKKVFIVFREPYISCPEVSRNCKIAHSENQLSYLPKKDKITTNGNFEYMNSSTYKRSP